MSFLGDLINTIGGDRAPAPPVKAPSKPVLLTTALTNTSKSAPSTPVVTSQTKPVYKGTAGSLASQQVNTLKRKADDDSSDRAVKTLKPSLNSSSDPGGQKPNKPNGGSANPLPGLTGSQPNTNNPIVKPTSKAPTKGSYAEMMAKAKEAQTVKTPSQIGMIKHQAREKIKTSKLAERKREDQDKANVPVSGPSLKSGQKGKVDPRRRSASPTKKSDTGPSKQLKAPRPPLHGPAPTPAYRGTMNQAPKKSRDDLQRNKASRYNEYLGTDEEEDDEDEDGYGGNGFYSGDESDDMEGGFDDVEAEERAAAKAARDEDAREQALEAKLKREKLDRKQKLAALVQKRR